MLSPSRAQLLACCGSTAWVDLVAAAAPFEDVDELVGTGSRAWATLDQEDWVEALGAHPRIGDRPPAGTREAAEQAAALTADPAVLAALAAGNAQYEERFGRTYVVRASGRSAEQMLALLEQRLSEEPADELATAAGQQWEITELRLRAAYGGTS